MRQSSIILTVSEPEGDVHEYVYTRPSRIVVGRADDCDLHVHPAPEAGAVSGHHCLIEVNPPRVCVRDLGSIYGTLVNGAHIGGGWFDPLESALCAYPVDIEEAELKDGDELTVGPMSIQVHVEKPEPPVPLGLAVVM
jgi:eukaryotic-like serine/threonine-protein kinase